MSDADAIKRYNYEVFAREFFEPIMNWDTSPPLGEAVRDFPLWQQSDQSETTMHTILSQHRLTVVEFGSFT